jgi:membrane protein involved in colicin uptake
VYFKKLGGDMQVFKDSVRVLWSYFTEFGQGIKLIYYKIMDKITAGDKYKKLAKEQEQKITDTQKEREELKKGISDRMKANRAANAHDSKNLDEKKRLDAEKNKLDYDSGTEALLKQFGIKENSKFHIDAKKDEFNKEKLAAEEKLAAAKTTAEKKAAIGKIEDAEKKLADLDKLSKGEAVPKEKSRESLPKAEAAKKELEQKGEEKTAADKKAADEKAKAEEKSKEETKKGGKGAAPAQESAETLLASLNTKMTELIKINKGTQAVSEQQLSVQKGMTSDLFAA